MPKRNFTPLQPPTLRLSLIVPLYSKYLYRPGLDYRPVSEPLPGNLDNSSGRVLLVRKKNWGHLFRVLVDIFLMDFLHFKGGDENWSLRLSNI